MIRSQFTPAVRHIDQALGEAETIATRTLRGSAAWQALQACRKNLLEAKASLDEAKLHMSTVQMPERKGAT